MNYNNSADEILAIYRLHFNSIMLYFAMKLLTEDNAKIQKSLNKGYKTYGLHLAPHKLSGKNLCTSASKGCAFACLNTAGLGVFKSIQNARLERTKFFNKNQKEFLSSLRREIFLAIGRAEKMGMIPCFRLNLTSDILWEKLNIIQEFPTVQFYDYTKHFNRIMDYYNGFIPENYHLTFSRSESNEKQVNALIADTDVNIAVVFKEFPDTWKGRKVVNGDNDDLRFLDDKGVIVGLKAKGRAIKDKSGFVV